MKNREIKFRAWCEKNKKMTDEFSFSDFDGEYLIPESIYLKDMVIMQFTNLLDKNGKEIYEGDVVIYYNPVLGQKYEDRMKHKTIVDMFNVRRQTIGEENEIRLEVIGNIYENPDLLK